MDAGYPLLLQLTGRRVLVVGGGRVAARRAVALADAGARVQLVAPRVVDRIAGDPRITVTAREYVRADLAGAWLVHACTGVPEIDGLVAADAETAGTWCVRASSAVESAAWTPAVCRSGDVVVAVNAGGDPARAAALRDAIALLLAEGSLPLRRRRPSGSRNGDGTDRGEKASARGRVALVGGGPGDPELITVRGRRLLAEADVVAVDRLAPRELLSVLAPDATVIDVSKRPGVAALTQAEINDLLIHHARQGNLVVRLKGGDPFVFGRGGEEMLACARAGVPCTVVPGVSSAVAVPAAAGIPVTHRGVARGFTVITGHEDADLSPIAAVDGTLVVLMGAARVAQLAKRLLMAGRSADTPVAVIENGTLPGQRTTRGTLETIGALADVAGVRSPAVIVVGDVVDVASSLATP
jgi:uroporphyrin-III C-methyltransferase/precorrin-2 dehydrogenase/sirohydrochlorin ferrochelatase